ncbi:hypothetical protein [Desulfosporosinus youngiae]|uniref:hypothetical protein n=1 Tax=Desulfosporosinus youngiae TaxID=339862 RepID=UPI003D085E59
MSATLRMFDVFSQPLQNITQSLNISISAMNELTNASAQNAQITNLVASAQLRLAFVETGLQDATSGAANAQAELNNHFTAGQEGAKGFISSIRSLLGEYLTFQRLKDLGEATIGGAMEQRKTQDMFIARTGDSEIGTAMFNKFKKEALAAGQDINKSLQSSLSFFSSTQNVDQLTKLNNLTQRLNAFDTSGNGIEGAASVLNEAMSGDITSLGERFNMSKSDIQAFKINELGKSGDIEGFIEAFEHLLEKQKMGQVAFDEMMKSPVKQMEVFTNNMESSFANAGVQALDALAPLIIMLNDAFQEGKFQPFFDGLSAGLTIIVGGVAGIVNGLIWLGGVVQQNWDFIAPILAMVGSALTLWAVSKIPELYRSLCLLANPVWQAVAGWVVLNWQILLVGAVIGLVLYAMVRWGDATVEVIGFIGGLFGIFFGFLFNRFAFLANIVLGFAEFFANVLKDPIYAVQKLFYDLSINSLQYMANLAKGIENLLNYIPGLKVNITSGMDNLLTKLEGKRDSLKSEADVVKLMRFNQVDYGDAFTTGQTIGKKAGNFAVSHVQDAFGALNNAFRPQEPPADSPFNPDSWNQNSNINRVNEVGRIENTVDISSEDIKTMRELAEMKNIQNFVTLTPTANYMHNGDVNNGQNVDTIVTKIKTMLETEIVSSTNGMFPI